MKHVIFLEKELNRLLRSPSFCTPKDTHNIEFLPEEKRILEGQNCKSEKKLLQRSPIIQEITLENHDYRMLSIGISNIEM